MKDKDDNIVEASSAISKKEKKNSSKKHLTKLNNKSLWTILTILVVGLIWFVVANDDTFHLMSPSSNPPAYCSNTNSSGIVSGVNRYDARCFIQTKEQLDQKRWQDILQVSPLVIAIASTITAITLVALTWQVSRLVKVLDKRKPN